MFNSTNYYQEPINNFQIAQIQSNLEHIQRQINSITRQMNSNVDYNSTFYRNRNPYYPYFYRSRRNHVPVPNIPTPTNASHPPEPQHPPTHPPPPPPRPTTTNTTTPSDFRSVLDNLFNLNDMRTVGSMEISVNTPSSNALRDLLNMNERTQENQLSAFNDIESNTEIEILNVEEGHQDICVICRETFQNNDIVRKIKKCNHYFHLSCSNTWFNNNITCPLCRQCIKPNENDENENDENEN